MAALTTAARLPAPRPHPLPVQGDVRRYEDCQRMVEEAVARFGRLNILVNCAGGCCTRALVGAVRLCKQMLPMRPSMLSGKWLPV